MFIKKLYNDNEFDVFLGNGWLNHIRVRVGQNPKDVTVLAKAEHVDPTDKLKELIFFKIKRYQR